MKTDCVYCWNYPLDSDDPSFAELRTEHALKCDKNPMVAMTKEACDRIESARPLFDLLERLIGTQETGYWGSIRINDELIETFESARARLFSTQTGKSALREVPTTQPEK